MKHLSKILIIGMCLLLYADEQSDSSILQLDKVDVFARAVTKEVITVAEREIEIGIHDDVNKIIFMNPGVNRVPEAGSQLLIAGGSIYDNLFLLNDVPMFIPAHFSGHSFMDVNNILVPALQQFSLIAMDIPGNYAGASNGIVKVDPGQFQFSKDQWIHRPQILLTLGTYDAGLCITTPFRNGNDLYQLTGNVPNAYLIRYRNVGDISFIWSDISYYDACASPLWYEDITFTGKSQIRNVVLKEHVWVALDAYSSPLKDEIIPWGAGSISLEDAKKSKRWKITAGGSRQYVNRRRILGTIVTENHVNRSNVSLYGEINKISLGTFQFDCNFRGEYLDWNADSRIFRKKGAPSKDTFYRKEVSITVHAGMQSSRDKFIWGINLLGGGMVYDNYSLFIDPGIWSRVSLNKGYISAHGGINTSWPDIRGLPSLEYRSRQIKTYMGSIVFQKEFLSRMRFLLQGNIRWKDHCTALSENPEEFYWDPKQATSLLSLGISGEWSVDISRILAFRIINDFNRSDREKNGSFTTYEWEIPWSVRPMIQFKLFKNRMNAYLSGVFCEGLPYRELRLHSSGLRFEEMKRVSWYRRIDIKLQFDQPVEDHRFFTGFTAYLDINIFDLFDRFRQTDDHNWENIRDYYWNEYMVKKPVYLERSTVNLGVRASFRL